MSRVASNVNIKLYQGRNMVTIGKYEWSKVSTYTAHPFLKNSVRLVKMNDDSFVGYLDEEVTYCCHVFNINDITDKYIVKFLHWYENIIDGSTFPIVRYDDSISDSFINGDKIYFANKHLYPGTNVPFIEIAAREWYKITIQRISNNKVIDKYSSYLKSLGIERDSELRADIFAVTVMKSINALDSILDNSIVLDQLKQTAISAISVISLAIVKCIVFKTEKKKPIILKTIGETIVASLPLIIKLKSIEQSYKK